MYRIVFQALASLALSSTLTTATPITGSSKPDIHALSSTLGLQAAPNFTDEKSIWATTFSKIDAVGISHAVQLPRVYIEGKYDAAASEASFVERFGGSEEAWKAAAAPIEAKSNVTDEVTERWAAYLKLQYCNDDGDCTGFELSYNSNGCREAPGTHRIEVFYSTNAAFVAYNHGGCSGHSTLFAIGCNAGGQDVNEGTPGTNSFQYIVGCVF
ncbi:hypothetical protein SCUP234_13377 [Seiridium cupressi]